MAAVFLNKVNFGKSSLEWNSADPMLHAMVGRIDVRRETAISLANRQLAG